MLETILVMALLTFVQLSLGAISGVITGLLIGKKFFVLRCLGWLFFLFLVIGYIKGTMLSFQSVRSGEWKYSITILSNIFLLLTTLIVAMVARNRRRLGLPVTFNAMARPRKVVHD